jgi:hypothetical protein
MWTKIPVAEKDSPIPRYGHTTVYYKGRLIIFGGAIPKDYMRPKEDILYFEIGNLTFI